MPDTRPCPQGVRHTRHSHRVIESTGLSNADVLYQVGAIIWHPESQRFLLFITRKGPYKLPAQGVEGNLGPSLSNPLDFVARETGHTVAPVRLHRYERLYKHPFADRCDELGLVPATSSFESADYFKVTVDMLCDPEGSPWGQARQLVTFWFGGVIVDPNPPISAPAKPTASTVRVGHLVSRATALNVYMKRGYPGMQELAVLEYFITLWNQTYPENQIR